MEKVIEKEFELFFINEVCKTCVNKIKGSKCVEYDECSANDIIFFKAGYKANNLK